jgi:hypothetical protein
MRHINRIVVHCSATKPSFNIGASEITEWHMRAPKGWRDIGYHAVIRQNGVLEHGRDITEVGAHAYGYNKHSIGICMVGGLNDKGKPATTFSQEQFTTLRAYIKTMLELYPDAEVMGHRDLSPDIDGDGVIEPFEWVKQCPCFNAKEWYYDGTFS